MLTTNKKRTLVNVNMYDILLIQMIVVNMSL